MFLRRCAAPLLLLTLLVSLPNSAVPCRVQVPSRCREVLDLLTTYLDDLGTAGESGAKFLSLYQSLIGPDHWKHYLALKGLLPHLGELITAEIQQLSLLEETTLNADLSQGRLVLSL